MCCGPKMHHSGFASCSRVSHSCCCSSDRNDNVEHLEQYLDGLQQEAKAVEKQIADIKKST